MPARILFERTLYSHWGQRSGYARFIEHLDPQRFSGQVHATPDSDKDDALPVWLNQFRPWLRTWIRQHGNMDWYKLVDFAAEIEAYNHCSAGQIDIVHFLDGEHSGQFLPRAIKKTKTSSVRTIATFHQPPDWANKVIDTNLLHWFDAIVLVSPSQRAFFARFVPEDRLHVILHGVDVDFFRPAKTRRHSEQIRCITTGHWLRDWTTFEAVARALPDIAFDVVTGHNIGVLPNVNLHTGISDCELAELYCNADILFLPLIESTANNTLLEGIASGLPVVATDLESVRSYLPSGQGLLVRRDGPDGYVDALRQLQTDVELREDMGRRARQRANELGWGSVARLHEDLYQKLLNKAVDSCLSQRQLPSSRINIECGPDAVETSVASTPKIFPPISLDLIAAANDLIERGLYEKAVKTFETLLSIYPDDYRVHAGLARTAEIQWRWRAAIERWDRCTDLMPNELRAEGTAKKAQCMVQIGLIEHARELFLSIGNRFEGIAGQAWLAELQESPEVASDWWERCTLEFPDQLAGFVGRVKNLMDLGRYAEADQLLWHVILVWPESERARSLWASYPATQHDWETSNARWKLVLARHSNDVYTLREYGRYLARLGGSRAVDLCQAALPRDPTIRAEFLFEYYSRQGAYEYAAELCRKLTEFQPENLRYRLQLSRVLSPQGLKAGLRESVSILEDIHGRAPDSVIVKLELAEAYIRSGLHQPANDLLGTIPSSDNCIGVEILRAWAQHQNDGNDQTIECWRTIFLDFELLRVWKDYCAISPSRPRSHEHK